MAQSNRPLNIAIGVHGRFHAFDVAKALTQLGQKVTLFTNYPSFAKKRFGIEAIPLTSFALHGAITRGLGRIGKGQLLTTLEPWLHQTFGKWLAHQVTHRAFDVVDLFSGIAEETLQHRQRGTLISPCILERGSSHIRSQHRLLVEEEKRTHAQQDKPGTWMISREEREYMLADQINVLSTFAQRTFMAQGISANQLTVTPLGVNTIHFRADSTAIQERLQRIEAGEPLTVLYVGQVGYRKGFWDLCHVAHALKNEPIRFLLVGTPLAEVSKGTAENLQWAGHQPQSELSRWYAKGDIFIFPTIEDGFGMVLAQAQAAGLPILATTNCSAPDFIEEGKSGWIVPIRAPERIVEQLEWCHANRPALAEMVRYTYQNPYVRDWLDVGRDYLTLMQRLVSER